MKILLLTLVMLISSAGLQAQVPLSARIAEGTKALALRANAGIKNFFMPATGRYAGWQNVVAGIAMAGMVCTISGCSVKYKEEQRPQIELLQNLGKWGGGLATGVTLVSSLWIKEHGHAGKVTFFREDSEPLYVLIPLTVFVASLLWDASSYYVTPNGRIYAETPEPRDTLATNDADLRNYYREHLTPATYSHVFSNTAYEDGWVAVPTNAELFADKDTLAGVVTSLEQADTIYYGRMTEPAVFTLDALKHKEDNKIQLLAEERVFSVVVPSSSIQHLKP